MPKKYLQKLQKNHHSILWRSVRHSVFIAFITAVVLSGIAYLMASSMIEQRIMSQLIAIVSASEDKLQTRLLQSRSQVASVGRSFLQKPEGILGVSNDDIAQEVAEVKKSDPSLISLHLYSLEKSYIGGVGELVDLENVNNVSTVLIPTITGQGWQSYDLIMPLKEQNGEVAGWIAARFESLSLLHSVLPSAEGLGQTGKIILSLQSGDDIMIIEHQSNNNSFVSYTIGSLEDELKNGSPVAYSLRGQEGLGYAEDYNGNEVLAAYRFIPDLGWGLTAKVNLHEVLAGPKALMDVLVIVGALFLIIAVILSLSLSRKLIKPLIVMSKKVEGLSEKSWKYDATITTNDELQLLDEVIAQITTTLGQQYECLEGEVESKTDRLKKNFAKDKGIFEAISSGLLVLDSNGIVTEANPAAASILKTTESEVIGKDAQILLDIREKHKQLVKEQNPVYQCLASKKEVRVSPEIHISLTCADGSYLPARLIATPLFEDNKCIGAVVLFQDVSTERRLDYMKSEFITLVSHQLRTPLSTVQWYSELLATEESENLTEDQVSFISELRLASGRMTDIVSQLMDASRLQKGGVEPVWKDVDLVEFTKKMVDDIQAVAREKGVTCQADIKESEVTLSTDPMLLNIIFQNLLSNSIKYTKSGGSVRVSLQKSINEIEIVVKDNGIGIPKADQDRIFQKLFRAHNARETEVNGSGLGLYSSKKIIETIGGTISFKSDEGKGSTFTVSFPA